MLKAGALKISKYPTPAKLVSPFLLPLSGSGELPMSASAWMGGESGGEHIHVYVWLRPFTVHLKLSQHC